MRKNLAVVAGGGALAFALAGAASPAVAGGSAYPASGAAGTVLAGSNGDIHIGGVTANGDHRRRTHRQRRVERRPLPAVRCVACPVHPV